MEKELLLLAGKLAIACENLLKCNIRSIDYYLSEMERALDDYNNAIMEKL